MSRPCLRRSVNLLTTSRHMQVLNLQEMAAVPAVANVARAEHLELGCFKYEPIIVIR